ncbi:MAG: NADP-dependent oxidoreductase [Sandaracinaceae bacterium]|nr:NADP-dependent oxidoreductase [Sandaracinaceae bacterium]
MTTNRVFLLEKRPDPDITDETLRLEERPVPEPADGEVLVRNTWLSLDPTNRSWMNAQATYLPPIPLGHVMRGITAGRVVASRFEGLEEGALVSGMGGFADYAALPGKSLTRIPDGVDPRAALSVLGHIGLTAYFGLLDVGRPKEGDTVLVSAAAGATGSLVGQIAKLHGCRVVGTAGSDEKCAWLTDELGFDAAINYRKTPDLTRAVREACPKRVDVFFDNVGGAILDAALASLAMRGRVVVCGGISQYNAKKVAGPSNYLALVVARGRMEGFVVLDYLPRANEALAALVPWLQRGELKSRYHVVEGLENAASALQLLFEGGNQGKLLVAIES